MVTPILKGRESYPSRGKEIIVSGLSWLKDKAQVDQNSKRSQINQNIWKVRNKVYDFSKFIQNHPGGPQWLELTRGQDVTDFYESYHINQELTDKVLQKYYLHDDKDPQPAPFTYEQNGFYKTAQRRVAQIMKNPKDRRPTTEMHLVSFSILAIWIASFILLGYTQSYIVAAISGLLLSSVLGVGHNYLHQPNNIWYYLMDLTTFSHHDWTISHSLSHHTYTNMEIDLEIVAFEPFLFFLTTQKENPKLAIIYSQFIYALIPLVQILRQISEFILRKTKFRYEFFLLIGQIYVLNLVFGIEFWISIKLWYVMQAFQLIATANQTFPTHRSEGIWTEGDKEPQKDFGLHMVITTLDHNLHFNLFFSMFLCSGFNDHICHHLFPSIDKSQFYKLRPILEQTCKEFNVEKQYSEKCFMDAFISTYTYLIRTKPKQQIKNKNE